MPGLRFPWNYQTYLIKDEKKGFLEMCVIVLIMLEKIWREKKLNVLGINIFL